MDAHTAGVVLLGGAGAALLVWALYKIGKVLIAVFEALAAATGASTKELMARMGHSSIRAALIYQHASRTRDKQIADAISQNVGQARLKGHARGTTAETTD